jgi:hypothetical protein
MKENTEKGEIQWDRKMNEKEENKTLQIKKEKRKDMLSFKNQSAFAFCNEKALKIISFSHFFR